MGCRTSIPYLDYETPDFGECAGGVLIQLHALSSHRFVRLRTCTDFHAQLVQEILTGSEVLEVDLHV